MERNGESTDLGDRNRAARARNDERDRLRNDKEAVSAEIIDLAAERERREAERDLRAAIRTHSPPRILDTLTERRATFSRGDLNRALAKVIIDPKERAALTDRILALPDVIGLKETEGPRYRATRQEPFCRMRGASSRMPLRSPRGGSTRSRDPKVGRCCDIIRRLPAIGTPPFAGLWRPTDLP